MGSVLSNIQCPNCKSEDCLEDYNYRTGETYAFCPCGYTYKYKIKRNADGTPETIDGSDNRKLKNIVFEESETINPYGSYSIKFKNDMGFQMGSFETEEQCEEFMDFVQSITPDKEIEFAEIIKYNSEDNKLNKTKLV